MKSSMASKPPLTTFTSFVIFGLLFLTITFLFLLVRNNLQALVIFFQPTLLMMITIYLE